MPPDTLNNSAKVTRIYKQADLPTRNLTDIFGIEKFVFFAIVSTSTYSSLDCKRALPGTLDELRSSALRLQQDRLSIQASCEMNKMRSLINPQGQEYFLMS